MSFFASPSRNNNNNNRERERCVFLGTKQREGGFRVFSNNKKKQKRKTRRRRFFVTFFVFDRQTNHVEEKKDHTHH